MKYNIIKEENNIKIAQKIITTKDKSITILWNKRIMEDKNESFARQPDIYIQDNNKKYGNIIDVTIVQVKNIKKAFYQKMNTYRILQQKLRRNRGLIRVDITPVVITTSGLINKESVRKLKQYNIEIDFKQALKYVIINNMQDLMFYLSNTTVEKIEENEEEITEEITMINESSRIVEDENQYSLEQYTIENIYS